jgi:fatty-acyl-CoA synthase
MSMKTTTVLSAKERRNALEERFPVWPRNTIADHFYRACSEYKNRPFVFIPDDTIVTYGEVWANAWRYAKAFLKLGVMRRDHIAILMENDSSYPSLMIAASLVGAVFIPVNTMLRMDEIEYLLCQSDTKYLLLHQIVKNNRHGETIAKLLDKPSFQKASKLEKIISIPNIESTVDKRFMTWHEFSAGADFVQDKELEERWQASRFPDEVATIMYTSGSTGKSKGVMLTHDMLLRCAYSTCISRAIEDGRVTFAPLPFYHCFAIIESILAMPFVGGAMISPSSFSPLAALQAMEKFKANDFLCVPSMLVPLLNHPRVAEFDLSHLFAMWCGAAPAPVPVWQRAMNVLGLTEVCTGYGQTEVSSSGVTTEVGDAIELVATRVGRPKLGGVCGALEFGGSTVQYKTIDRDTGRDLPAGAIGELAVRGNTVTHGYYKKPEETSVAIDKDGWLRTGDVGRIDENGYIELLGRSKELYKVSGELVAPREVEEAISKHPAVNQVYIVGVPDGITTEAGAAFVELCEGETCSRREIVEWCNSRVARFKIPRHVWFVEANTWPMTSTGKVQKFRLQEIAKERLGKMDK